MPNIGFFELLLIGVVALLVLGPEKLPGAIRTTSLWVGRARRSFNKVKSEIERELNTDEIRRQLHNESILADLEEAKKKAKTVVESTKKDIDRLSREVDQPLQEINALKEAAATNPALLDEEPEPAGDSPAPQASAAPAAENPGVKSAATDTDPAAQDEPKDAAPVKSPPQDFYNNPGVGVIELRDGKFQPAPEPADEDKAGSR